MAQQTVNEQSLRDLFARSLQDFGLSHACVSDLEIRDVQKKASKHIHDLAMEFIWKVYHPNSPFNSILEPVSNRLETIPCIDTLIDTGEQSTTILNNTGQQSNTGESTTLIDTGEQSTTILNNTGQQSNTGESATLIDTGEQSTTILNNTGQQSNTGESTTLIDTGEQSTTTLIKTGPQSNTTHHHTHHVYGYFEKKGLDELLSDLYEVLGDKIVEESILTEILRGGNAYVNVMVKDLVEIKFLSSDTDWPRENVTKIDGHGVTAYEGDKTQKGKIQKVIESYGGRVVNSARTGVTAVLAPHHDHDIWPYLDIWPDHDIWPGESSKLAESTEFGLPICREPWLNDSIEKMQTQPLAGYEFKEATIPWDKRPPEEEAAESVTAELKLVGKRAVYKETKLEEDGGKIYEKGDILYNCALSSCDIPLHLNEYAILQLIEVDKKSKKNVDLYLYVKEGRVGDRRGVRERLDKQESPQAAVREFNKVFQHLTGNKFLEFEREKKFSKQRNKYFPIDMAPGVDARAGALRDVLGVANSKVDQRTLEFLKIIFSQEIYKDWRQCTGFATGNLTEWHINLCKKYLVEFCEFLKTGEDNEQKKEQVCLDFSNKWFTLLHSTRPFVIHELSQLTELASPTLESVRDISHASMLLGDMSGEMAQDSTADPITDRYRKMNCLMTPLDREGDDYKMIVNYFTKTMETLKYTEGEFNLVIEDIVQLESLASPSLEEIQMIPNRILLWSGMRTSNLFAALHRGMLPALFDAPASCYSFGKGIYFTDAACKAAQYGFTAVGRNEGFLLLSIVGLEDCLELVAPEKSVEQYEEAGVCVKINGKRSPDSDEYVRWKFDVTVPCGTLKDTSVENVRDYMDFNQYVAYNSRQVKPMFLIRTKFQLVE